MKNLFLVVAALTVVCPSATVAQFATFSDHTFRSETPVAIQRLSGPIDIDGRVDEPAWDAVTPIPWHVYSPTYGAPASQNTELRVAYDDEYIYFSCRCYDSEPENIRTTSYKRDFWDSNYDQIAIALDTFLDRENALVFVLTAAGVRVDVAMINDVQGDAPLNLSWNAFWDGETTITGDGWFGEVRIPLSSLRFNTVDDISTMGLMTYRYIARRAEFHIYPERRQDWGFWSFAKPSQSQEVVLQDIESSRPVYFTPYVLAGASRAAELNDDETDYVIDDGPAYDIGLDMKVGLTRNLTLDVTANTDFAQVEADDQQVNLTRFSLFFPERRLFFQERATNFELNFGQQNRLFYTRRIGINDGQMVTLLGGLRLVGRIGRWDIGALNMQSGREGGIPTENFGVLRLRRQVINPSSYAGTILTSRIDEDGGENIGLGADAIFRLRGDDYLTVAAVHTFDDETDAGLDATRLRAHVRRERIGGWTYDLEFNRAGEDYRPDLGFELRDNYTQVGIGLGYGILGSETSMFKRMESGLSSDLYTTNGTGDLQTRESTAEVTVIGWNEGEASIEAAWSVENLDESFDLSDDIEITSGRYSDLRTKVGYQTADTRAATVNNSVTIGSFFDGTRFSLNTSPSWNVSKVLELSGTYQYDHINFETLARTFVAHTMRVKVGLTFNRALSLSSFVQFSSDSDLALGNFRLRYNPREGNDFYLVFNQAMNTDRFSRNPVQPYIDSRAVVMKYSYTLVR